MRNFGDIGPGDTIYTIDPDTGSIMPIYTITKVIPRSNNRVSFACNYYIMKDPVSDISEIYFPVSNFWYPGRFDIYMSDDSLDTLCRSLIRTKVERMASKINSIFGGLFKMDD